ncbi:armadillo-type protein [Lipomyces kononenkoae]|uniref:Armadillo-type protein n=1 Tax=Lipomyces kononenkoae TaxID=34357 RepID=A0ACC3T9N6_LIPKO
MLAPDNDFDDCPDLAISAPSLLRRFSSQLNEALALSSSQPDVTSLVCQIEPFQDSPQLIDPMLEDTVVAICRAFLTSRKPWHCRVLYVLVKIRGAKTVSRFFPNDVALLERILCEIEQSDNEQWESRYILLIWLSVLVLTPFKLSSIDNDVASRAYTLTVKYLSSPGREREAAAIALARFLVRADTQVDYLPEYVEWSKTVSSSDIFAILGTLATIAGLFTLCSPADLEPYLPHIPVVLAAVKRSQHTRTNAVLRKLLCKATCRLALCSLALSSNEVPESVENCLGELITTELADKDTLVRYSASKAVSRVAQSLATIDHENVFVPEIIDTLFASCFPKNTTADGKIADRWHGGLLALAELLRRHVLPLPRYSTKLFEVTRGGLQFEIRMTTHAIGANVRDAACYVAWSLFRHYPGLCNESSTTTQLVQGILSELTLVACFDREVNNRRAAAAAVQECIGRHPEVVRNLETGIALVQCLDYFAIGSRAHAFLEISREVSMLGVARGMIEFLIERVICSWDVDIRRLAGKALALILSDKDVIGEYALKLLDIVEKIPDGRSFDERHGYVYALGEILDILPKNDPAIHALLPRLKNVFDSMTFPAHHAFVLYDAALHVIGPAASLFCNRSLDIPQSYMAILNDALSRTGEDPSTAALRASACSAAERLPNGIINPYDWIDFGKMGRPGFILALGSLRPPVDESVILSICELASKSQKEYDISIRIAAVRALDARLSSDGHMLSASPLYNSKILVALANSLQDYTTLPSRGDIGSHLRLASIKAIAGHASKLFAHSGYSDPTTILTNLVRISLEKMDKLRLESLKSLRLIVPLIPIADTSEIRQIIAEPEDKNEDILTNGHVRYFEHMIHLCGSKSFLSRPAILGLAACVGGGTGESVVRAARDAVLNFLTSTEEAEKGRQFVRSAVELFVENAEPVPISAHPTPPKRDYEIAELIGLLFEMNLLAAEQSSVYIQTYNKATRLFTLAMKTNNPHRIGITVGLFSGIFSAANASAKVKEAAARKLVSMLVGNMKQARQAASDALFLLASEKGAENVEEMLGEIDWTTCDDKEALKNAEKRICELFLGVK